MAKEEKIFLKKEDEIDDVIDRVKNSKAEKVILNIPQDSILKSSLDNFHTLKRESLQADKDLLIESVDPHIEELADLSKIKSINPVFGKKEKIVSDIIPRSKLEQKKESPKSDKVNSDFFSNHPRKRKKSSGFNFSFNFFKKDKKKSKKKKTKTKTSRNWIDLSWVANKWLSIFIAIIILGGLYYIGFYIMPQAEITLTLESSSVDIDDSIQVSTDVSEVNINPSDVDAGIVLPGELISSRINNELRFPASEEGDVERRASGQITIFNEYDDESITLVDETRFETPDGKIYRLEEELNIPPADVSGDSIEPSQITATVIADEPGEEYNISPSSDEVWTIPGFEEAGLTEMFNGFYAIPEGDMTGGFIGTSRHPSEEDIESARESLEESLRASLQNQILLTQSSDFKLLNDASEFEILNEEINYEVDEDGQFGIFADAQMRNLVFERQKLKDALLEKFLDRDYPVVIVEEDLNYDNISINWDSGIMTFDITGTIDVKPRINTEDLISSVVNKEKQEVEPIIKEVPELKNAKVSIWPFWIKLIPSDPSKITITVN